MLNMKLDEEFPDRVENQNRKTSYKSSKDGYHNTWMVCQPIPNTMRLDTFLEGQAELSSILATSQDLVDNKPMHTVASHNCVSCYRKHDMGISWRDL